MTNETTLTITILEELEWVLNSYEGSLESRTRWWIRHGGPKWIAQYCRQLYNAIKEHHSQKADDRCIEDDDLLYKAANLPPCDRRVGPKEEMLKNCARFIQNRCEEGEWKTYLQLEKELVAANEKIKKLEGYLEFTADGILLDECENFWCPHCKEEVRVICGIAYCSGCEKDEHGNWPVPMFLTSCLGKSPNG